MNHSRFFYSSVFMSKFQIHTCWLHSLLTEHQTNKLATFIRNLTDKFGQSVLVHVSVKVRLAWKSEDLSDISTMNNNCIHNSFLTSKGGGGRKPGKSRSTQEPNPDASYVYYEHVHK